MPEISPRIYQSCHVRPIPVRADYFVLTVDLRSAKRGGWRHKVNKKKIKKNIAAPLNGLFSAVYPSIFSKNKLPLFFFFVAAAASCLSQLPTGLFSSFLRVTFFLYSSQMVCEMRGFQLPALEQMWLRAPANQAAASPLCSVSQQKAKNAAEKTQTSPGKLEMLTWCKNSAVSSSHKSWGLARSWPKRQCQSKVSMLLICSWTCLNRHHQSKFNVLQEIRI